MTKSNGRKKSSGFYFDEQAADLAVMFFEKLLIHVKGEWAGEPFILSSWQRDDIIRPLFGWKRKSDGTRRYRRAYIELPRGNGKSTLVAGIALLLVFVDDEPGAEVYGAASDREQAAIVFDLAKQMVEASPVLSHRAETYKRSVVVPSSASVYRVLSADVKTKHGFNAHGVIADELHAWPSRELWDVLTTGTRSRRQPLVVAITTAGYDRESICWEQHEYARQVLEGIIVDDEFFAYVRAADEEDDWTDPKTWRKANPGLGVTVKEEYLAAECKRAQLTPAYLNTFLRLHLNRWTQQDVRWLPLEAWDDCDAEVDVVVGQAGFGGLDLASTVDIASFLLDFPPGPDDPELHTVLPFFWIPEENMRERALRDRVPYDAWVRQGFIKATPGNVIDYAQIVADIVELGKRFHIREIAFDRWGAIQMSQQLEAEGFTMVAFGQGFASMSGPTKELLRLTLDKKIAHGGHPVLRWMADNMMVTTDPAGNMKPDKKKSREKIDGIVALIMALDRAIRQGESGSVYETRGLVTL
jgi:phage terminase large subunit-like protein